MIDLVHVIVAILDHDLRRLPEVDVVLLVGFHDRPPFTLNKYSVCASEHGVSSYIFSGGAAYWDSELAGREIGTADPVRRPNMFLLSVLDSRSMP